MQFSGKGMYAVCGYNIEEVSRVYNSGGSDGYIDGNGCSYMISQNMDVNMTKVMT